jgi:phospholipid-translocating ATPase
MLDGLYQSVICFFMAYLAFRPANFVTSNGLSIDERVRFGVYIGPAAVVAINLYILLNTYRWDWLMSLLVAVSILLVWFWTGVYSAFSASEYFYKAAAEVFGQPSFWAVTSLSVILSLMPRFVIKTVQKIYFPYDIDIVREQVRQGKFAYLDVVDGSDDTISKGSSTTSDDIAKPSKHTHYPSLDEDQRPIYPPSVAATATTHNPRSQNGSDGTEFTRHRTSIDPPDPPIRPSMDRARPSFDRMRASMDRIRPSYEQSNDFTSAALLTRLESSHSFGPVRSRRNPSSGAVREQ